MYNAQPVNDALLRKLSAETQLVGKTAMVKGWAEEPEYQAMIVNVIILPFSIFYRKQFMTYYEQCNQNAVKALKELVNNYPNTYDYELDTGYVLQASSGIVPPNLNDIKHRNDFMLVDELARHRQELLTKNIKVLKKQK